MTGTEYGLLIKQIRGIKDELNKIEKVLMDECKKELDKKVDCFIAGMMCTCDFNCKEFGTGDWCKETLGNYTSEELLEFKQSHPNHPAVEMIENELSERVFGKEEVYVTTLNKTGNLRMLNKLKKITLDEALNELFEKDAIVKCNKLEEDEFLFVIDGKLHYEDGGTFGDFNHSCDLLNSFEWVKDAEWFVESYLTEQGIKDARKLICSTQGGEYFKNKLTKTLYGE